MIAPAARGSRMVDRKTNIRTFEPSHLSPLTSHLKNLSTLN